MTCFKENTVKTYENVSLEVHNTVVLKDGYQKSQTETRGGHK